MSKSGNLTLVVAVKNNIQLTRNFFEHLLQFVPEVKVAIGALGVDSEMRKLVEEYIPKLEAQVAFSEDQRDYSFSENYNAAIGLVKTSKMVLVHNDMFFSKQFFGELSKVLDFVKSQKFLVYSTVEPLKCMGSPRPGKIIIECGNSFEDFREDKFQEFVDGCFQELPSLVKKPAWGFYLAGFTKSFKEVGGFDIDTFIPAFCEDDDLILRIRQKGYDIWRAPRAICYHFGSLTSRPSGTGIADSEIRSNRRFCRKWGIEACNLWNMGVFLNETTGPDIRDIKIKLSVGSDTPLSEILALEPLFDYISRSLPEETLQKYLEQEEPLPTEDIAGKFDQSTDPERKVDVVIWSRSKHLDKDELPRLVAALRLKGVRVVDMDNGDGAAAQYFGRNTAFCIEGDPEKWTFREDHKIYLS